MKSKLIKFSSACRLSLSKRTRLEEEKNLKGLEYSTYNCVSNSGKFYSLLVIYYNQEIKLILSTCK